MLSSGIAELVSLGAVLPFLAVLSNPEQIWDKPFVRDFASKLGYYQSDQLILPVTLLFVFSISCILVRLTNLWMNSRLAAAIGSDLSCKAYTCILYQPYELHLQRNTSEVITGIAAQITRSVAAITSYLQLITACSIAFSWFVGLLLVDWKVALGAFFLFGSAYTFLAIRIRRELRSNSHLIASNLRKQVQALQEGLGAIRDVILDRNQQTYVDIYRKADRSLRRLDAKNQFLRIFPRYSIEALGLIVIALFGGVLAIQEGSGSSVIPLLGVVALGAQRLLPALQLAYGSWAVIKASEADLNNVLHMLNRKIPSLIKKVDPMVLQNSIDFELVSYRYSQDQPDVLKRLSFNIKKGERVGLIGSTGSGKSTIVDILMCLLKPTNGRLLIDGLDIHDTRNPKDLLAWQASIAHVPQSIFLSDASVAENIAFGTPASEIDFDRVRWSAKLANISQFIEGTSDGYSTFVGERGVRLSGGQLQRIGCQALYKNASILIFDEATSALDNLTEDSVMWQLIL